MSKTNAYVHLFITYLRPLWAKVLFLTFLIFVSIGLQVVNPQVMRYFIDTAVNNGTMQQLIWAAATFIGMALLIQIIDVLATYYSEDIGWASTNQMRTDLMKHCLHLDMTFHNEHTPGEMITRIDGDATNIAGFFTQFVIRIAGNFLLVIAVILVLLREDWRISLALLIYALIALVGLSYVRQVAVPFWALVQKAVAELYSVLEEHLTHTEAIRGNGATAYTLQRFYQTRRYYYDTGKKAGIMNSVILMTWRGLYGLGQLLAIIAVYVLYNEGQVTIGSAYLIIYYVEVISTPLNEITEEIRNVQQAIASIGRVQELRAIKHKLVNGSRTIETSHPLRVEFDNVSFHYTEDEPVLQNISFQLEPGKTLGIVGRTGSGKTTLMRLLFRLYDPVKGEVFLSHGEEKINLRTMDIKNLRQHVGMITQQVQLFHATVRENLTFFDDTVSDEQLLTVIETLGLTDWLASLPHGLDTVLESQGTDLSAGEAQLLAFTRVFLTNPGLILLDEASSRLDPATEQHFERGVDHLLQNRTGIIIAHRLNTVRRVDYIMVLENGQIKEMGAYDLLIRDPHSHFSALLQAGFEQAVA